MDNTITFQTRDEAQAAKRPHHIPAYCEPDNEVKGDKYEPALSNVEIAKRLRTEIKEKIKAGTLPKMKVSITTKGYNSISIKISELEALVYEAVYLAAKAKNLDVWQTPWRETYRAETRELLNTVEGMAKAYRRDNSDLQSDYFDCNFYLNVSLDWQWASDKQKAEMEAEAANPTVEVDGDGYGKVRSVLHLTPAAD